MPQGIENTIESRKGRTVEELCKVVDRFFEEETEVTNEINSFWKDATLNSNLTEDELNSRLEKLNARKEELSSRIIVSQKQTTEDEIGLHDPMVYFRNAQDNLEMVKDIPDDQVLKLENDISGDPEDDEKQIEMTIQAGKYKEKLQRVIEILRNAKSKSDIGMLDEIDRGNVCYHNPSATEEVEQSESPEYSLEILNYRIAFPGILEERRPFSFRTEEEQIRKWKSDIKTQRLYADGKLDAKDAYGVRPEDLNDILVAVVDNPELFKTLGINAKELGNLRKEAIVQDLKKNMEYLRMDKGEEGYLSYGRGQSIRDIKGAVAQGITTYEELGTNEEELKKLEEDYKKLKS